MNQDELQILVVHDPELLVVDSDVLLEQLVETRLEIIEIGMQGPAGPAGPAGVAGASASPGREILTSSRTYYVRKNGSDLNNGLADTASGAFLTIQKAVNAVVRLDFGNNTSSTCEIRVADGVYEESIKLTPLVGFAIGFQENTLPTITGNILTPQNVVIYPPGGANFAVSSHGAGSAWRVTGFEINATRVNNYRWAIVSAVSSILEIGRIDLKLWSGIVGLRAYDKGSIYTYTYNSMSVTGACLNFIYVTAAGNVDFFVEEFKLVGVNVAYSFAEARDSSAINFYADSVVGSVTGKRYEVSFLSIINAGGPTAIPGSIPGTADNTTGGYYL